VEWRRSQHSGELERHIRVVVVVASPCHRSVIIAMATDGRAREECGLELAISSSPCSRGLVDGSPSRSAQQDGRIRVAKSHAPPCRPPEADGGVTGSRPQPF
jgi:hypothetical protein